MVSPIDYTMDVLSPIEGYMQGLKFGEGIQTDRLNRELAQSQEGRAQETFAMQNRDREAARANASRQRAQAEASQAALADLAAKGLSATSDDFVKAWVANPAIRTDLGQLRTMLREPQIAALKNANQSIYSAASTNNPEVVARLLNEQIAVAQSPGGDPSVVDSLQFSLDLLTENPESALAQIKATTGLTLLGLTSAEYMKQIDERLGVGGDQSKLKSSDTIGGIASVQVMDDGTTQIVDTRTNTIVTGTAATALLDEARKQTEKPLSGIGKLAYDLASGAITQDQFDERVAAQAQSGVSVTNVIGGASETLAKVLSTNIANQLTDAVDAGVAGSRRLATLGTLNNLLIGSGTGVSAKTKQVLGTFGIATEGIGKIQAAEALISSLIPTAKTPGSGPMTDADAVMFKNTFPSLLNSAEGNALILQTLEDVSNYEVAAAIISGKVIDWAMTDPNQRADLVSQGLILSPKDGRKAILELPKVSFTVPAITPVSTAGDVLTREQFIKSPSIINMNADKQERIWLEYKKIKGIE